jgi:hypothetical protein
MEARSLTRDVPSGGLKHDQVIEDELVVDVKVYGFTEDGAAAEHVLPREALTVFHKEALTEGESDPRGMVERIVTAILWKNGTEEVVRLCPVVS